MASVPTLCIICGAPSNGSRCPQHQLPPRTLTTAQKQAVLERDRYACQIRLPGCKHRATVVDHIKPRRDGGTDHPSNLQAACQSCNSRKGARNP